MAYKAPVRDLTFIVNEVLDIDRYMPLSMAYEADGLADRFKRLHEDIQVAFKALTTDHARAVSGL